MSSLEELLEFNEELTALTRAGVPIDLGLSQLSRDPDTANQQINAAVTRWFQGSGSLVDAVSKEGEFPPVYQSVVCAGLRCGRLPAALEALSRNTQPVLDVRQAFRSSLVYPVMICLLAYVMFAGACLYLWPTYDRFFADMGSGGGVPATVIGTLRDWLPFWIAIPPVLLAALLIGWLRSSSLHKMPVSNLPWLWSWLPGVSKITADQSRASLAELLALLVEHEVPLHEALHLAARASGDHRLTSAVRQMASDVELGQPISQASDAAGQLPPFLRWALTSSTDARGLGQTLRSAAKMYRNRAQRRAEWLRVIVPALTCVFLAGGATLLYGLSIFGPLIQMIRGLS